MLGKEANTREGNFISNNDDFETLLTEARLLLSPEHSILLELIYRIAAKCRWTGFVNRRLFSHEIFAELLGRDGRRIKAQLRDLERAGYIRLRRVYLTRGVEWVLKYKDVKHRKTKGCIVEDTKMLQHLYGIKRQVRVHRKKSTPWEDSDSIVKKASGDMRAIKTDEESQSVMMSGYPPCSDVGHILFGLECQSDYACVEFWEPTWWEFGQNLPFLKNRLEDRHSWCLVWDKALVQNRSRDDAEEDYLKVLLENRDEKPEDSSLLQNDEDVGYTAFCIRFLGSNDAVSDPDSAGLYEYYCGLEGTHAGTSEKKLIDEYYRTFPEDTCFRKRGFQKVISMVRGWIKTGQPWYYLVGMFKDGREKKDNGDVISVFSFTDPDKLRKLFNVKLTWGKTNIPNHIIEYGEVFAGLTEAGERSNEEGGEWGKVPEPFETELWLLSELRARGRDVLTDETWLKKDGKYGYAKYFKED